MDEKIILLVEDNPDDEDLTLRVFRQINIKNKVVVARDGAEALDMLFGTGAHAGRPIAPELVLLDINLPKIDGLQVLERMRADERTRSLPVVILTSSRDEQDVARAYRHSINSYIQKPVDFKEFSEAAAEIGLYWLVLNEPPPRREPPHE